MFNQFIQDLEERLKGPLPGRDAQIKMSARLDKEKQELYFNPPDNAKLGGVLILLYPQNGHIYLPLMLRPTYKGIHSGQVSFPGGKMEQQDTDLVSTALREAEEEIGISRERIKIIGNLSELYVFASNFKVLPVVGFMEEKPVFHPDRKEVEQVIETNLAMLLDPSNIKRTDIQINSGFRINAPYYDVDGHVVWGATAVMLSEFVEIVKNM